MADWGASLNNLMPGAPTHFGPDINAILSAQRNALALQQAQQVLGAQNALGRTYADPQNLVPGTNQLTPQAISGLASRSPLAVTDALKMNANMAQQQSLNQYRQSEGFQRWAKQANDQADQILSEYDAELKNGVDPKQALTNAQSQYSQMITGLGASGMPPNMRQMINPTFDPTRIRARQDAVNVAKLREKQAEIPVEAEKERAIGAAKQQANPEYAVPMQTGEGVKDVPVVSDGKGGWRLAAPPNTPVQDVSGIHKIGTKADAAEGKFGKVQEVTIGDPDNPGKTKTVLAQQNAKTGGWVTADANRDPLPAPTAVMSATGAGGRESVYIQRALTSGQEAVSQLKTIAQLPSSSSGGFLGLGRTQGVSPWAATKEVLVNQVSSQEVQAYKTLAAGLQRELASLAASGVGVNQHYIDAFNSDMLAEGDTQETKLLKLARQRQTAENALEAVLANPRLGEEQRKLAENQVKGLKEAIPWTPLDVVNLLNSEKPGETLGQLATKRGLEGTAGKAEPPKPDQAGVYSLTDPSQIDSLPPGSHFRAPGDPAGSYRLKP